MAPQTKHIAQDQQYHIGAAANGNAHSHLDRWIIVNGAQEPFYQRSTSARIGPLIYHLFNIIMQLKMRVEGLFTTGKPDGDSEDTKFPLFPSSR